jgi:hypothetical protein
MFTTIQTSSVASAAGWTDESFVIWGAVVTAVFTTPTDEGLKEAAETVPAISRHARRTATRNFIV